MDHPREVDDHLSHGAVANYWGCLSSATTHLLDAMQYRGLLRVELREAGFRSCAAHEHEAGPRDAASRLAHLDALVDVIIGLYAPLPAASLSSLVRRLRFAVPQWRGELDRTQQRETTGRLCPDRRRAVALAGRETIRAPAEGSSVPPGSRGGVESPACVSRFRILTIARPLATARY